MPNSIVLTSVSVSYTSSLGGRGYYSSTDFGSISLTTVELVSFCLHLRLDWCFRASLKAESISDVILVSTDVPLQVIVTMPVYLWRHFSDLNSS